MQNEDFKEITLEIKKITNETAIGVPWQAYFLGTAEKQTEKFGINKIHKFMSIKGDVFKIYGFTALNMKLEQVKPGHLCQITYNGTQKVNTKYGKKDIHQVTVASSKKVLADYKRYMDIEDEEEVLLPVKEELDGPDYFYPNEVTAKPVHNNKTDSTINPEDLPF